MHILKSSTSFTSIARSRVPVKWIGMILIFVLLIILLMPNLARLSLNVWLGAIASGLCFAFIAIGVLISFRVLNYPDLTIDGSFPLGAAITASMIIAGVNPYLTITVALLGGTLAGVVTALIATRLHIHSLLASIITTTALFSINLRIMGRSNIPLLNSESIFTPYTIDFKNMMEALGGTDVAKLSNNIFTILYIGLFVIVIKIVFDWFMRTEVGLAMRATGDNPQMIRSLGTNTDSMVILGLAISNGLVAISGAIYAQYQGFTDINMGTGMIIAGMAAVILGESIFRPKTIAGATAAVILGMILYRLVIAAALSVAIPLPGGNMIRVDAQDVKLATAVLVLAALWFTYVQKKREANS